MHTNTDAALRRNQEDLLRSFHRSLCDLILDFEDQGLAMEEMLLDLESTYSVFQDDRRHSRKG